MRTTLARIVLLAVGLAATSMAVAAQSRRLDLATPEGRQAFRRVQCSAEDRHPVVYYWTSDAYGASTANRIACCSGSRA
jgi:hypothetical protein